MTTKPAARPAPRSEIGRARPKAKTTARRAEPLPPIAAPEPKRPRGRARSDVSRLAILAATLKLLKVQSVQSVTMEAIAKEAEVSKATIYRWWTSKASVVIDAFVQNHLINTPMPQGVSARQALEAHIRLLIEQYGGWPGRIVAQVIAEGQSDPGVLREFRERFLYGRRAVVREVVDEGRRNGEFRTDLEAEFQMDLLYAPIYQRLLLGQAPLDKAFADSLTSLTLRLLEAPAGAPAAAPSAVKAVKRMSKPRAG